MSINFFGGYKAKKYEITENFKLGGKQVFDCNTPNDKLVKAKVINVSFDDDGLKNGVDIFALPKGNTVLNVSARVTEVWNSGTSDKVDIYIGSIKICDAKDLHTAGLLTIESTLPFAIFSAAETVKAKVTSVGTAATKGKLEIIITYTV